MAGKAGGTKLQPGDPGFHPLRPPFEPGNTLAQTHGATSPRVVQPLADELGEEIRQVAGWLESPLFALTLERLAYTTTQIRLVRAWLDDRGGAIDDEGEVRAAATFLLRLEATAAKAEEALGLTPRAWAALLASLAERPEAADEVAALQAVGRELVAGWHDEDHDDDEGSGADAEG